MKMLINMLFAGIKAKNKGGYLYQNNRPYMCKQPQVNTMNNPKLGLFNLLTPMEIATEALFHHTKEEMKGGKPKSASSRLCSASE